MKILINTSILLIILNKLSFPQFYADSSETDSIIELMKIADEHTKQNDPSKGIIKLYSDEEIYHIAKLYYKCYNDNPVGFQKYVNEKHKVWAPIDVVTGKTRLTPWMKVYALKDIISYKYGIPFTEIISCPAFIRARFDSMYHSSIYIPELKSNWLLNNYVFLIEEVLKGNKFFRNGVNCTITFSPNAEAPEPEIVKGKPYLIPITTWVGSEDYKGEISFCPLREEFHIWVMGKPPKTFPIENEIIKNCDYFGIKDTSWTDFKKYFTDTYLIFE
jgi:hypothetical protein